MFALLLSGSAAAFAQPAPESIPWIIQVRDTNSQISYQINTREAVVTNGVIVTYSNTVLTANFARLNEVTGDVQAEGGVRILRAGEAWTGEKLRYNFRTREISGEEFRTGQPPFFAAGDVLMSDPATKVNVAEIGRAHV